MRRRAFLGGGAIRPQFAFLLYFLFQTKRKYKRSGKVIQLGHREDVPKLRQFVNCQL